jgi:transcription termination factor Rho
MNDRLELVQGVPCSFNVTDLRQMSMAALVALARQENIVCRGRERRAELVNAILQQRLAQGLEAHADGVLELMPDGFGYLRSPEFNYEPNPCDIYVAPSQIMRYALWTGDTLSGPIRGRHEGDEFCALLRVDRVNGRDPHELKHVIRFEERKPQHPQDRLHLERDSLETTLRVLDLLTPLGKGDRGLIEAPPRTGKTTLLEKIARALTSNHPECFICVLLIDETPEDIARMQDQLSSVEVVGSTFEEPPSRHVELSSLVLERAKRLVESGQDVVLLLDSLTRLARAWNIEKPRRDSFLSGGVQDSLPETKRFFGSARNLEGSGSLTILATALTDTGSRMDEVIFEEFKGTGTIELHLDRRLSERGIWPAIDVNRCVRKREDRLVAPGELHRRQLLRRVLADISPVETMELLLHRLNDTASNTIFLNRMQIP